jgi:drug/metabolite transporter (DMT)-like permease
VLAAALFGASTPASKALLGSLDPFGLAGLLYLGAALSVAPAALRGSWRSIGGRGAQLLAGAVLFGGIAGPVLMLQGLHRSSASSVALWLNLETPATLLLGWLAFKEHIDRATLLAVALVLVASTILAAPFDVGTLTTAAFVGAACLCWGLDNNLTSLIDGLTPSQVTFTKGLVAGAVNLSLAGSIEPIAAGWALGVGALGYGLSLVLYVAGAQQLGATHSQTLFATAPFWGLVLAWAVLGEPVRAPHLAAGGLMVVSVALLSRAGHSHRHAHSATQHTHWHRHDDDHHDHDHEGQPDLDADGWHIHNHGHEAKTHSHEHRPDLHHRHDHGDLSE